MWPISVELLLRFRDAVRRWSFGPLDEDDRNDPAAGVRVPRRRNPGGRESAIALVEPTDDHFDEAVTILDERFRR